MLLRILLACRPDDTPDTNDAVPPDLSAVLGAGEVRAGIISNPSATWGGLAAEGIVGDLKIYNDRVRFVIQGNRDGSFYVVEGGGVIDADIVRPEGEPGREFIDEWAPMFGFGRVTAPAEIVVAADGADGTDAVIRVTGSDVGLSVMEGALESPGIVPSLGLNIVTEYRLPADSWLLEVTTTVTPTSDALIAIGDVLFSGPERADRWNEGAGMGDEDGLDRRWSGYASADNDLAVAIVAPAGDTISSVGYELITELAEMVVGFTDEVALTSGVPVVAQRWYGVAPDFATLSDAALAARGEPAETLTGVVMAPDGPVAGARVAVLVDDAAFTLAVTGSDGSWSADVPVGSSAEAIAVGRSRSRFSDLPAGAVPYGPYASSPAQAQTLLTFEAGAPGVVAAEGRGIGGADPMALQTPGTLVVSSGDNLPFTVLVGFIEGDVPTDSRYVSGRPNGKAAQAWARDGEVAFPVEPGTYSLLAHRGLRFEVSEQSVTIGPGETVAVDVVLPAGFSHDGWLLADPHSHASPSPDGEVTMEDRLITSAAAGIQVHFGTDHDHLADYRPLLAALGLHGVMTTVVADEVSPPVRGHLNIYPVEPVVGQPNNGAWSWWRTIPSSTQEIVDTLRATHGPDFVLQSNHPLSGLPSSAGWSVGRIPKGDYWTQDLQAVEVLNGGGNSHVVFWHDMVPRGYAITPVGVSDSHGPADGDLGFSATMVDVGLNSPVGVDPALVADGIRSGQVVATRCPFPTLSLAPGATLTGAQTLDVDVRSASWCVVDRVLLYENGVEVERLDGTSASFSLSPATDAVYAVIAEGDTPTPVTGSTPWAMTGAIRIDVAGDGWTAPLPPLEID